MNANAKYKDSVFSVNMPLRLLMYIARVYEKIIDRKKLYQSKPEKIPEPEFIVLYNGKADYPDHETLKLSELFKDAANLKAAPFATALELIVQALLTLPPENVKITPCGQ